MKPMRYIWQEFLKSEISRRGISIQGIVCDGRQGLFGLFGDIPIQMCHFHQIQIVQRYYYLHTLGSLPFHLLCDDRELVLYILP